MSSHRHRFSHHQPTWRRRVKQFFRGKWLSAWFIALQRVRVRWQRNLRKLLAPRWLRKTSDSLQARVRKAESKVARVRKSILRKIARSTVGWSARQVARRSRILELRCAGLLKKSVLGLSALAPEPVRRFFRAVGRAFWHVCSVLFVFVCAGVALANIGIWQAASRHFFWPCPWRIAWSACHFTATPRRPSITGRQPWQPWTVRTTKQPICIFASCISSVQ